MATDDVAEYKLDGDVVVLRVLNPVPFEEYPTNTELPKGFVAVVQKHGQGTHNDKDHGNWARGYGKDQVPANEVDYDSSYGPIAVFVGQGSDSVINVPVKSFGRFDSDSGAIIETWFDETDIQDAKTTMGDHGWDEWVSDLANDIKENGILQPISLNESATQAGKYIVSDGNHRVAAAIRLGLKRVPVVIGPNWDIHRIQKHAGPGPHPGTGTPQTVHGGQFSKPMIYVGADEVDYADPYGPRGYPLAIPGQRFIKPDELPAELYHVTTNLPSVQQTGILKANLRDIGLGGGRKDSMLLSLTVKKEIAAGLMRDMKAVALAYETLDESLPIAQQHDHMIKTLFRYAGPSNGFTMADIHMTSRDKELTPPYETVKYFFSRRESMMTDRAPSLRWRDPLFMSGEAALKSLRSDRIGMITVKRKALADGGAAIMDFDLGRPYGLEEISYFGDIVLR